MLVSFALRVSMTCRACHISMPINGIASSTRCYHCGETRSLDARLWTAVLNRYFLAEAYGLQQGVVRKADKDVHIATPAGVERDRIAVAYTRGAPRCRGCEARFDVSGLAAQLDHGQLPCPKCGQCLGLRAADALSRAVDRNAVMVVGESALSSDEQALQARRTPVLFQCMGCGGPLNVDGATRAVTCEHCGASNYLPDGLWQQLAPVPKEQWFFLICDYDAAAAKQALWLIDDTRRSYALTEKLTEEDVVLLLRDHRADVRAAVARNPHVPVEVLRRLAQDDNRDPEVR
ncbi:MAG TPA: hypothetical protein VMJ10_11185 [Kofleriaceae bacterium]|nr:hypothetical protein [Kofleriaceae bacterium]